MAAVAADVRELPVVLTTSKFNGWHGQAYSLARAPAVSHGQRSTVAHATRQLPSRGLHFLFDPSAVSKWRCQSPMALLSTFASGGHPLADQDRIKQRRHRGDRPGAGVFPADGALQRRGFIDERR